MEFKTRIISVDFLLAAMLLFIIAVNNNENINILEHMKNGMENPAVVDYYQEGINDVMTITYSKRITIWYYETDLNDDGLDDLIAIVSLPLHFGAHEEEFLRMKTYLSRKILTIPPSADTISIADNCLNSHRFRRRTS